ncbi:transcriptional regulator, LacI family [Microbacterium enclense]|uniref:Transcriptional regulator, LacI family n=2 Tax=Microbacterium enclense TaxID=993073 RepID=A0A1G6GMT3_9MICO|nr:transcriptional regulator [Microbacterium enclense]SDB83153.1 transcriptional regulator, LacI family [Microbacterium enclense]
MSRNHPPMRQQPSMYDVAYRAGVSHMTVSRVINGHSSIREATRSRVLQAIEEMQYTPSSIARALATRRTRRIGVVIDETVQNGPNNTLRALEKAARGFGYAVSAFSIGDDSDSQMDSGVRELVAQGVDALCIIAPRASSLDTLRRRSPALPTIVIKAEADSDWHTVGMDQRAGARLAVEHLIAGGHRSIAHLAGPQDWYDARERDQGWQEAQDEAGLTRGLRIAGDWTSDFGYDVAKTTDWGDTTAIFAANDQIALGAIHGLQERGIDVPSQISIVGFDDLSDARHFLPPLTTVRQDFEALGKLALQQIIDAIEGDIDPTHDTIEPVLTVRNSTRSRRGK